MLSLLNLINSPFEFQHRVASRMDKVYNVIAWT